MKKNKSKKSFLKIIGILFLASICFSAVTPKGSTTSSKARAPQIAVTSSTKAPVSAGKHQTIEKATLAAPAVEQIEETESSPDIIQVTENNSSADIADIKEHTIENEFEVFAPEIAQEAEDNSSLLIETAQETYVNSASLTTDIAQANKDAESFVEEDIQSTTSVIAADSTVSEKTLDTTSKKSLFVGDASPVKDNNIPSEKEIFVDNNVVEAVIDTNKQNNEEQVFVADILQIAATNPISFAPDSSTKESASKDSENTIIHYKDGAVYEGQVSEQNKRNGTGTLTWKTGETYSGNWDNDQLTGNGTLTWPGLGVYTGEFVNGKREGQGKFTWIYDGEPEKGSPESFEGNWKNDKIGDKGKLVLIGIGTYDGQFAKQVRSGNGTFRWEDGAVYEGAWANDGISGKGNLKLADGTVLDGTFASGVYSKGTMTYAVDGGVAKRSVASGKVTDNVEITYSNRTVVTGKLKKEDFTGNVSIKYASGDTYVGALKKGLKDGKGTYTWRNGAHYIGEWKNDKMSGQGKYYYGESEKVNYLTGTFSNGTPSGTLIYVADNKLKYETYWYNGKMTQISYKK